MTTDQINQLVIHALEDLKAVDIHSIDVSKLTSIADTMIFASGRSSRQVKALADNTLRVVKEEKITPLGVEGISQGEWALIDLGDVIVHIMQPAVRDYYQLEKLWTTDSKQQMNP